MSRAFVDDDRDDAGRPRREFDLPAREDPGFDAAAAKALLEAAREGGRRRRTGDGIIRDAAPPAVEAIRKQAAKDGGGCQQLAEVLK
jgi:hypothetical protein